MPLHKRENIRDDMLDSIYANRDLMAKLPSTVCPHVEMLPVEALQAITDELLLDGNARQNLATFCQTWEEPEVHKLMDLCMDKNLIDKDEYPQTAELERRCVHMLADQCTALTRRRSLSAARPSGPPRGFFSGGMAAKQRRRGQAPVAGKRPTRPTRSAGRCRWSGTSSPATGTSRMRENPMSPGRWPDGRRVVMLERVDENTIMVVPVPSASSTRAVLSCWCSSLAFALDKPQARRPGLTSTSTSTSALLVRSWPRSAPPTSLGTSAGPAG